MMDNYKFIVKMDIKEAIKKLLKEDLEITKKREIKKNQILKLKKRMDKILYEEYQLEGFFQEDNNEILSIVFDWELMDFPRTSDYSNVYDFKNCYKNHELYPFLNDFYEKTNILTCITEY